MRVAFVHDYLTQFGGAERVLLAMHEMYPEAPIYTSLYDPSIFDGAFASIDVRTTWLQRIPFACRFFRALLPLYPRAFESIDLSAYDLVISSTSSFAKGVRVRPGAMHVAYIHTPTRFIWRQDEYAFDIAPAWSRALLSAILPALKRWDYAAAQLPTHVIANSANVADRIKLYYGRTSDVVHCPADIDAFTPAPPGQVSTYYLVATRMLRYKRVQLAIEACRELGAPLVIIGSGPDEGRLRSLADGSVRFTGQISDAGRRGLFACARAVIVPGEEDFGLVPIEAAAAGRPTVAYGAGGALETVVDGVTGVFFKEPTASSLSQALRSLDSQAFDVATLRAHAQTFSGDRFRERFRSVLAQWI